MTRMPKIPKVREYVELTMGDGTILKGHVFIEATSRVQDLLNSELRFFPFIDEGERIHLINKEWVRIARPYDG